MLLYSLFIFPEFIHAAPYAAIAGGCKCWFLSIILFEKFFSIKHITVGNSFFRVGAISDCRMLHPGRLENNFAGIVLPFLSCDFFDDKSKPVKSRIGILKLFARFKS